MAAMDPKVRVRFGGGEIDGAVAGAVSTAGCVDVGALCAAITSSFALGCDASSLRLSFTDNDGHRFVLDPRSPITAVPLDKELRVDAPGAVPIVAAAGGGAGGGSRGRARREHRAPAAKEVTHMAVRDMRGGELIELDDRPVKVLIVRDYKRCRERPVRVEALDLEDGTVKETRLRGSPTAPLLKLPRMIVINVDEVGLCDLLDDEEGGDGFVVQVGLPRRGEAAAQHLYEGDPFDAREAVNNGDTVIASVYRTKAGEVCILRLAISPEE